MKKTEYEVQRQRKETQFKELWSRHTGGTCSLSMAEALIEMDKNASKNEFRYRILEITSKVVKEIE